MTDAQLYLAIGLPSALALVNIGVVLTLHLSIAGDIRELREHIYDLIGAINELDKRITRIEIKLGIQP